MLRLLLLVAASLAGATVPTTTVSLIAILETTPKSRDYRGSPVGLNKAIDETESVTLPGSLNKAMVRTCER